MYVCVCVYVVYVVCVCMCVLTAWFTFCTFVCSNKQPPPITTTGTQRVKQLLKSYFEYKGVKVPYVGLPLADKHRELRIREKFNLPMGELRVKAQFILNQYRWLHNHVVVGDQYLAQLRAPIHDASHMQPRR